MKKKFSDKRSNIFANHCKCALHARPNSDKRWRIQVPFSGCVKVHKYVFQPSSTRSKFVCNLYFNIFDTIT